MRYLYLIFVVSAFVATSAYATEAKKVFNTDMPRAKEEVDMVGYWGFNYSLCPKHAKLQYFSEDGTFELRQNGEKIAGMPTYEYHFDEETGFIIINDKPYFKLLWDGYMVNEMGTDYKKCESYY